MKKDTLLRIAWLTGLLAPVDEAWNSNIGSLLLAIFLLALGTGLATPNDC